MKFQNDQSYFNLTNSRLWVDIKTCNWSKWAGSRICCCAALCSGRGLVPLCDFCLLLGVLSNMLSLFMTWCQRWCKGWFKIKMNKENLVLSFKFVVTYIWLDITPCLGSLVLVELRCWKYITGLYFSQPSTLVFVMKKANICLSSARRVQLVGWRVKMFGISQPQRGKLLLLSSVSLYFCALQQDFNPNRSAGTLSQTWVTGCICWTQVRTECAKLRGS